jgi:glycosyltransferase involved in cell wall biosynthesis
MDAFKSIDAKQRKDWELLLIGNGHLLDEMQKNKVEGITIMDFLQPPDLAMELSKGGFFVLPSISEPWGIVVHELAALGYPMILSENCGAGEVFLDGNGIFINPKSTDSIKDAMIQFMALTAYEIDQMKTKSVQLSKKITPEKSAETFFNALTK